MIPGKRPLNILQTIGNGCAFLDYDRDGNLDILLIGPKLALYRGDGKGHFSDVTQETGLDRLSNHFLGCAVGDMGLLNKTAQIIDSLVDAGSPPIEAYYTRALAAHYLGDYDTLSSDFTGGTRGFIGAFQFINTTDVFQPNPDVKANRVGVPEEP